MKKLIITGLILLMQQSVALSYHENYPYNMNWYIRSDKSEEANKDRKYFDPPAVGTPQKKPNKIQRILYRADKPRMLPPRRYNYHVSGREYRDCSYYLYVDCSNYAFCRCWQCRDYVYDIQPDN